MSIPNKTQAKLNTLKIVLDDLINSGEEITIPRVCELAGCSRSFLYQNKEAKILLENAKPKLKPTTPPDILLQYEELKRKLQDSYILQYQLLSAENERLKTQINDLELQVNYLKSSPKFSITFKIDDSLKDELVSFQVKSMRGNKEYNPVRNTTIENLLWGDYIISSLKYDFRLEQDYSGVILEKALDGYLLSISDDIKEAKNINIIVFSKH